MFRGGTNRNTGGRLGLLQEMRQAMIKIHVIALVSPALALLMHEPLVLLEQLHSEISPIINSNANNEEQRYTS